MKVVLEVDGLDLTKLEPALAGPAGAIVALLMFIGYLMNELRTAKREKIEANNRYEIMRTQYEDMRLMASDAIRSGKRSTATLVAATRHLKSDEDKE